MGNENALAIIERAQKSGALVFVNQENFQSKVELYKTEATVIQARPDEFHNLQGKFMPNRPVTDRIGEAAGVEFVSGHVRSEMRDDAIAGRRTVFIGTAQGKVRMPDGHWRMSAIEEYEFDPVLRAMLDKKIDYITETNRSVFARAAMEYTKVATQRAATGARLRVIRQLTGMPTAFSAEDMKRPLVFTRTVLNTEHILDTKEGRTLATMQALGMNTEALYGKRSDPEEHVEQLPKSSEPEDEDLKQADTSLSSEELAALADKATGGQGGIQGEFEELTVQLEALVESNKELLDVTLPSKINPYQKAKEELENFAADVESRRAMIKRTSDFIEKTRNRP